MSEHSLPERQSRINIGGIDTFILEAGDGDPVVLFHGASIGVDSWLTWFRCFNILARKHRVIAYDQPCFGRSSIPSGGGYLDREQRAIHASAVLDHLGLSRAALVGHSEGGFIATRLAIESPARVDKLVIITSGGTSPRLGDTRDDAWMSASAWTYDYKSRAIDEETYVRTEGHLRTASDPAFEAILRQNYRRAHETGTADCLQKDAVARSGYGNYTALQERLILPFTPQLQLPTLLVWAGNDPTVPVARGLALAEMLPASEMHVFPRSGHWVMHEEPEGFNRLLMSWLSDDN